MMKKISSIQKKSNLIYPHYTIANLEKSDV